MTAAPVVFCVSGHGLGHATRCAALIDALRRRAPEIAVHVRTEAPHWIFTERIAGLTFSAAPVDAGVVQTTGLDVDAEATLSAHQRVLTQWNERVEREAAQLRTLSARLVVADVPPLACAAARRAGVPAVAVANFSWDWILRRWGENDPRWCPIAARYAEAYADAETAFRLPLHGDFSAFRRVQDVPLLVNRSRRSRADCRAALGVAPRDPRRLVLVSFGGFGAGDFASDPGEDLSAYRFIGLDAAAPPGFAAPWTALARPCPLPHEDLVHASDAVIGKAGYSTIAEALAHGTRFLYLPRSNFPEVPVLEAGLTRLGCARAMPRDDFASGRWRAHLDALFARPAAAAVVADGSERLVDALLQRLGLEPGP